MRQIVEADEDGTPVKARYKFAVDGGFFAENPGAPCTTENLTRQAASGFTPVAWRAIQGDLKGRDIEFDDAYEFRPQYTRRDGLTLIHCGSKQGFKAMERPN